jgi:excinuclease ABC subunit A
MAIDKIIVKGARVHNLKNLDVEIPKDKLVVFTGVSGSGKSSLAFDTIYAEGQRRYVESLSAYARQFLGIMDKPDVDYIEGLSPAISIDQKSAGHNPRSTVGTVTEIYDYLRLLFARVGHPHSPKTGERLKSQSVQEIVDGILKIEGKLAILAPVVKNRKGTYEELFARFLAQGYVRAKVDGVYYSLEEEIKLEKFQKHNIEIAVDRLVITPETRAEQDLVKRITDSVERALNLASGEIYLDIIDSGKQEFFSEHLVDPATGQSFPKIEPHSFSFNSPHGACATCNGLGVIKDIDRNLVMNPKLSVTEGGLYPWQNLAESSDSWQMQILKAVSREEGFDLRKPLEKLTAEQMQILLYGGGKKKYDFKYLRQIDGQESTYSRVYEGLVPQLLRRYQETDSDYIRNEIEKYMREIKCHACQGKRLNEFSLAVTICQKNIFEVGELSITDFFAWVEAVRSGKEKDFLTGSELEIAREILKEILARTQFLVSVGLEYLTLNRTAKTLSGGESQRIRLASQIGTGLTGVLYVLDEPSIGLHQSDNSRLLKSLIRLRDLGNTVIVVEHDEDTIRAADYLIDVGPLAGEHGGEIVAAGLPADVIANAKNSLTADYLSGRKAISREQLNLGVNKLVSKQERSTSKAVDYLTVKGASQNNLKNLEVEFPLGKFVSVTGLSGSGKSSLITEILYPALANELNNARREVGSHEAIVGIENLDKVIEIDQSPIGRTPRSNPATYTGLFTTIRDLYAATREAKASGYGPGRFSFNTKGGRCENCRGDGVLKIEMQFLPDVYVKCEVCEGNRYNRETLAVAYRGKNIAEVLDMTVAEGIEFFDKLQSIKHKLQTLDQVGLGYIKLGQAATTLSGGEAQRVKLAAELAKRSTGKTIYILDEPTTGLHFEDVRKLLLVLHSLVAKGNSVVVIEHNLDVIKTSDWIIDLGPSGGAKGGELIAAGTPDQVAQNPNSETGKWLKQLINS